MTVLGMGDHLATKAAEERFRSVFEHIDLIVGYARGRGSLDCEAVAAEVMAIAWRRLADVPADDPRPWLIVTARNVMYAQWRQQRGIDLLPDVSGVSSAVEALDPVVELDPGMEIALRLLSPFDREALLLVAWEDLTPKAAAAALGISQAAFRVRLHRARKRLRRYLDETQAAHPVEPGRIPIEEL